MDWSEPIEGAERDSLDVIPEKDVVQKEFNI
jgi:hypothetical protein